MPESVVVVGASLGGIEALGEMLPCLPIDFPAPILLVVHTSSSGGGVYLSRVLRRVCSLPVLEARDGEKLQPGRVYVPPSDHHLLVQDGMLRVSHGPRENGFRPAIDPLFRSAAFYGRNLCVGVVLSGLLDDGAGGLLAIRQCGGQTVVQDPTEARHPEMPDNAIKMCQPDQILRITAIGKKLRELVCNPPPLSALEIPAPIAREVMLTQRAMGLLHHDHDIEAISQVGPLVPLTCPDCGGTLWQSSEHLRCHVGHSFSLESLLVRQDHRLEEALWAAVRAFEEKRKTLEKISGGSSQGLYQSRAEESQRYADRIRELLLQLDRSAQPPTK
ncbi:MAG: chemotaxis protein CheB [Vulcanimicrobiota bacterium]